jgi:hypothetical protein
MNPRRIQTFSIVKSAACSVTGTRFFCSFMTRLQLQNFMRGRKVTRANGIKDACTIVALDRLVSGFCIAKNQSNDRVEPQQKAVRSLHKNISRRKFISL